MKKFLIVVGMIMCFILGGCSVGSVDAKESNSNDNDLIGGYNKFMEVYEEED